MAQEFTLATILAPSKRGPRRWHDNECLAFGFIWPCRATSNAKVHKLNDLVLSLDGGLSKSKSPLEKLQFR